MALLRLRSRLLGLFAALGQLIQMNPGPQQFPDLLGDLGVLVEQLPDRGRRAGGQGGGCRNISSHGRVVSSWARLIALGDRFNGHLCLLGLGVTAMRPATGGPDMRADQNSPR
jgi:hypothetical protein